MDSLVSERLYIDWLPTAEPAVHIEDERVIVVQGRTGFYLDLRYKAARQGEADTVTWATVGWKTLQPVSEGQGAPAPLARHQPQQNVRQLINCIADDTHPRARFTAVFDSHRLHPETSDGHEPASGDEADDDPPDEGSFSTLPNDDVLERGEMRRPETGEITPYEERWRRLPLTRDQDAPVRVVMLESTDGGDKAFLGRVGDFEVAIARRGDQVEAIVRRLDGTAWETIMATVDGAGLQNLDSIDLTATDGGGGVELAGRRWKVIEQSS
ncbi:hypothetical protein RHOSPDRAFT_32251 [Rhodotorula sp. JG-1b]|nr:hypothetical protein RHOSPDRAFT_32251 [Rhodotorula sp. JG-1b]